jgi:hypothetical protein
MTTRERLQNACEFNSLELDLIRDALNYFADSLQKMAYDARERPIPSDYSDSLFGKAKICYELAEVFDG